MIGSVENAIFMRMKRKSRVMPDDGTLIQVGVSLEEANKKVNNKIKKIVKSKIKKY